MGEPDLVLNATHALPELILLGKRYLSFLEFVNSLIDASESVVHLGFQRLRPHINRLKLLIDILKPNINCIKPRIHFDSQRCKFPTNHSGQLLDVAVLKYVLIHGYSIHATRRASQIPPRRQ